MRTAVLLVCGLGFMSFFSIAQETKKSAPLLDSLGDPLPPGAIAAFGDDSIAAWLFCLGSLLFFGRKTDCVGKPTRSSASLGRFHGQTAEIGRVRIPDICQSWL